MRVGKDGRRALAILFNRVLIQFVRGGEKEGRVGRVGRQGKGVDLGLESQGLVCFASLQLRRERANIPFAFASLRGPSTFFPSPSRCFTPGLLRPRHSSLLAADGREEEE